MAQPPLPLEEATRRIAAIDRAIAAGRRAPQDGEVKAVYIAWA